MCLLRFNRGPAVSSALRSVLSLTLGAALTLQGGPWAHAATTDESRARAIQSSYYGDVAFHFFQDDEFSALSTLMASQQLQRITRSDDAELMRCNMLLSYGMHREAGEILTALSERGAASSEARDRAWFSLAKVLYQKGLRPQAEEALNRAKGRLPAAQEEERILLWAQLLIARGDYRGAAWALKTMSLKAESARFARFNLGVAQIKAGDMTDGMATLDALGSEAADTEEGRAVRDRANVALGFASLKALQPAQARKYFERVPLQGTVSNKALLGYGWAALDQQSPQSALVPWLPLSKREANDPAVLEAKVAVPYAYEQLKANGKAIQAYAEAIESFERQRVSLDASMEFVRSGQFVNALLTANPRSDLGEGWHMDTLPDVPHTEHLTGLMAQNAFQEAFKNLQDLRALSKNLLTWQDKVSVFKDTLATRRQALAQSQKQISARDGAKNLAALRQRVDAVAADVAQAESRMDGVVFADAKQRDQLARVARMQAIVQKPAFQKQNASPEVVKARDRVRLMAGLLNWQLAHDNVERLKQAKQSLDAAKENLAQAQKRDAVIAKILNEEPQRMERLDERMQTLRPQIDAMIPKVVTLSSEQQALIQGMALAELSRQKEVLQTHLAQAHFAVAKLYDQAAAAGSIGNKEAADAPKP